MRGCARRVPGTGSQLCCPLCHSQLHLGARSAFSRPRHRWHYIRACAFSVVSEISSRKLLHILPDRIMNSQSQSLLSGVRCKRGSQTYVHGCVYIVPYEACYHKLGRTRFLTFSDVDQFVNRKLLGVARVGLALLRKPFGKPQGLWLEGLTDPQNDRTNLFVEIFH